MRVIEGSAFIAAPSGAMTLAQLGADVIRFDQIGGEPTGARDAAATYPHRLLQRRHLARASLYPAARP